MQYSSRFWLYAPFAFVLVLAAGVMTQWWLAAGAFEKKLASLKGREAIPGVTLDWSAVTVGGFPFRLDANFAQLQIKGAGAHGPFAWYSEKFALHALTYGRSKIVYEAAGLQALAWTAADGAGHSIPFQSGSLHASSITDASGLARFDLDIVNAVSLGAAAGRFQFHLRRDGGNLNLMVRADSVTGMGAPRKLVQAYATLSKADATAPFLRGEMAWPMAMGAWRGVGGQAVLSQTVEPDLAAQALTPLY
jgi:hypothetical protein